MTSSACLLAAFSVAGLSACMPSPAPASPSASTPTSYQAAVDDCMRYGGATLEICEASARQRFGPQEAAATPAQWAELDATARRLGGSSSSDPAHLEGVTSAQQEVPVVAGRCTRIALAWTGSHPTHVSIMFGETNSSLAGTSETLTEPGTLEVCPDKTGAVTLSVSQLEAVGGAIRTGVRLEYAIATSDRAEGRAEMARRRQHDAERARDAAAQIETNLQISDARRGGEAFAASCARCRRVARQCVDAREDGDTCELKFTTCAQGLGTDDRGRVLCAAP